MVSRSRRKHLRARLRERRTSTWQIPTLILVLIASVYWLARFWPSCILLFILPGGSTSGYQTLQKCSQPTFAHWQVDHTLPEHSFKLKMPVSTLKFVAHLKQL